LKKKSEGKKMALKSFFGLKVPNKKFLEKFTIKLKKLRAKTKKENFQIIDESLDLYEKEVNK
jgi:hypothetical protein